MGVDMKVKAIYDSEIGNITRSEKNWKDVLKVAGQLYYKMSRPNVQKILYKNVQLVCLS